MRKLYKGVLAVLSGVLLTSVTVLPVPSVYAASAEQQQAANKLSALLS